MNAGRERVGSNAARRQRADHDAGFKLVDEDQAGADGIQGDAQHQQDQHHHN